MTFREGLLAELDSPDALVRAVESLHARGYRAIETYSPIPLSAVEGRLRPDRGPLGRLVFAGGAIGAALGYAVQWYADVRAFPVQVGGRPLHAVPAFIPATFEAAVLGAALVAFAGVLLRLGLPELWHPVFEAPDFERASSDRYWLAIGADDPNYDADRTRAELASAGSLRVIQIPGAP